jgi:glycine cleavage system regulatory protein
VREGGTDGTRIFKVSAHLQVPRALSVEDLKRDLGTLASALMMDIALGGPAGGPAAG